MKYLALVTSGGSLGTLCIRLSTGVWYRENSGKKSSNLDRPASIFSVNKSSLFKNNIVDIDFNHLKK